MAVEDHVEALSTKNQDLKESLGIALSLLTPDMLAVYQDFQVKRLLKTEKEKQKVQVEATGELL